MTAQATRIYAHFVQREAVRDEAQPVIHAAAFKLSESVRVPDGFWRWVQTLPSGKWRTA